MFFRYEYFAADKIIFADYSPLIDGPCLIEYFGRLCNDDSLKPGFVEIVYLYETTWLRATPQHLSDLLPLVRQLQQQRGYAGGLLVCEGPLTYDFALTYQRALAQIPVPIEVVKTARQLPAALDRLRSNPRPYPPHTSGPAGDPSKAFNTNAPMPTDKYE